MEIFILEELFEFIAAIYKTFQRVHAGPCLPEQRNSGRDLITMRSIFLFYALQKNETWCCLSVYKTILFLIRRFFLMYFYCIYWG